MRLLQNIIFRYTVVTFVVISLVSLGLGAILSQQITNHLIQTHIKVFPHVMKSIVKNHLEVYAFLNAPPGSEVPQDVASFFNDLFTFGAVFRIKVWGKDGTILWSDKPDIIGKNFRDNIHFIRAIEGDVSYSLAEPKKAEHATEKGQGAILEIYTPIEKDGQQVGVIELYESNNELYNQINRNIRIVWQAVSFAGIALYTLLFFIFYGAYSVQKAAAQRLNETQDVTIMALAYQAELRDMETGYHIERTSRYVEVLARELGRLPRYKTYLTDGYIHDLVKSAPLHDIGKVGISDAILCKPGKLSAAEFEEIKRHCEYGAMILKKAEQKLTFQSFFKIALQLVTYHHEKWNGEGYPHGLKGEAIPLSARVMALSDVYDALRSQRRYKGSLCHEEAVKIILEDRGRQFDPAVVDAFVRKEKEFQRISEQMADQG